MLLYHGVLFANFASSFPPLLNRPSPRVHFATDLSEEIYHGHIISTIKPDFIACAYDQSQCYFLRRGNVVYRCIWADDDIPALKKEVLFSKLRSWFELNSGQKLLGLFSEAADACAWYNAENGDNL